MEQEMQHLRAPRENLDTWNLVTKLFLYSSIAIASAAVGCGRGLAVRVLPRPRRSWRSSF